MEKIKKVGVKNIYCSVCDTWVTEFYVSRHIKSKSHFTKKFFEKEYLKKKNSTLKKREYVSKRATTCTHDKITLPVPPEYERYKISDGTIQKQTGEDDSQSSATASPSFAGTIKHETQAEKAGQTVAIEQVLSDCKTSKMSDRQNTFHHGNILLKGCGDMENDPSSSTVDQREQVEPEMYAHGDLEIPKQQVNDIPGNLLEAMPYDYNWFEDYESTVNATHDNYLEENTGINQEMLSGEQNEYDPMEELFPIEVLSRRSTIYSDNQ